MDSEPEPASVRALISLYRPADVAWWFSRNQWEVSALPGGGYSVRRGANELLVRTQRPSGRVEVWGGRIDGPVTWKALREMLDDLAAQCHAWLWGADGGAAREELIGESMALDPNPAHIAPASWVPRQCARGGSPDAELLYGLRSQGTEPP
jgi:hypothetical protein